MHGHVGQNDLVRKWPLSVGVETRGEQSVGLQASGMPMHSRSKVHAALISSKRCRSLGLSWPTATPRILGELRSAHSRAKINKSPEQRSLSGPMSSTSKRMPIQPADRDFRLLCLLPIKPASSRPPRHSVLPHTCTGIGQEIAPPIGHRGSTRKIRI